MRVMVAGAGGFIGGHLVKKLLEDGKDVISIDIKPLSEWHQVFDKSVNYDNTDLTQQNAYFNNWRVSEVYNLAADMGGIGFIENNKAACMLSVLINTNLLRWLKLSDQRPLFFYASSACIYPDRLQVDADVAPLKESDAYPAMPEDGYGWEKLFSERMCRHFMEDYGFDIRVARFHNVYGPYGTYDGGREKAPAAICRKIIEIESDKNSNEIEIWGDGEQTRSFMYIDDCITGIQKLCSSDCFYPINLGSNELVSINELVDIVESIAGISVKRSYDLTKPKGVRGRNSDNTMIKSVLDWEPSISLTDGINKTYQWIKKDMSK